MTTFDKQELRHVVVVGIIGCLLISLSVYSAALCDTTSCSRAIISMMQVGG